MNQINKKWFIIGLSAMLFLVSISMIFTAVSRSGKYPVDIVVAPSDAHVVIDGNSASKGINYLAPGKHTVSVSRVSFASMELELLVIEGDNLPFPVGLTPITEAGWEIVATDPAYLEFEGAAGVVAEAEGLAFIESVPIAEYLPFWGAEFNIDYRMKEGSGSTIILQITAESEENRELANQQIIDWGYNPSDFEIEYLSW